ncbi:MAG TPA: hypothetical protein VEY51_07920 [Chondromyces sp.]|nr:hypothetical protein [Chondromyces sp.]
MNEKHHHVFNVIDFNHTGFKTIFVKFTGYDAALGKAFEGEVKFVEGIPFGDMVHPQRSALSSECRQFIYEKLLNKYNAGDFE